MIDLEQYCDYNESVVTLSNPAGKHMSLNNRLERIAALVNEHGFLSVEELSRVLRRV